MRTVGSPGGNAWAPSRDERAAVARAGGGGFCFRLGFCFRGGEVFFLAGAPGRGLPPPLFQGRARLARLPPGGREAAAHDLAPPLQPAGAEAKEEAPATEQV